MGLSTNRSGPAPKPRASSSSSSPTLLLSLLLLLLVLIVSVITSSPISGYDDGNGNGNRNGNGNGITLDIKPVEALPKFRGRIPNGYDVKLDGRSWGAAGHKVPTSGNEDNLNPFGEDFDQQGEQWTTELCEKDSDGDGYTNGEELGDPDCVWFEGEKPARTSDITHPGFAADDDDALDKLLPTWLVAHVVLMFAAWVVIAPVAVAFPVFFRNLHAWVLYHRALLIIVLLLTFVGFFLAVSHTGFEYRTTHGVIGIFILFLGAGQVIAAGLRPHRNTMELDGTDQQNKIRQVWELSHHVLGRALIIFAAYNVGSGFYLLSIHGVKDREAVELTGYVFGGWLGFVSLIAIVAYVWRKVSQRRIAKTQQTASENEKGRNNTTTNNNSNDQDEA